jgi:hypothetical protein
MTTTDLAVVERLQQETVHVTGGLLPHPAIVSGSRSPYLYKYQISDDLIVAVAGTSVGSVHGPVFTPLCI